MDCDFGLGGALARAPQIYTQQEEFEYFHWNLSAQIANIESTHEAEARLAEQAGEGGTVNSAADGSVCGTIGTYAYMFFERGTAHIQSHVFGGGQGDCTPAIEQCADMIVSKIDILH